MRPFPYRDAASAEPGTPQLVVSGACSQKMLKKGWLIILREQLQQVFSLNVIFFKACAMTLILFYTTHRVGRVLTRRTGHVHYMSPVFFGVCSVLPPYPQPPASYLFN